jgi:hypothetical protein
VTVHGWAPAGRRRRAWRAIPIALCGLLGASCGAPRLSLPSGPGEPAIDAAAVVAQATSSCRAVSSIVAEGAVSGTADGRRVRGRLHLGVAEPASARLEAIAPFGQPLFIFVARGGLATLVLTRPDRVLRHDDPARVLEAIAGVPLDPADLGATLTGCAEPPAGSDARRLGSDWRVVTSGLADFYFRREGSTAPWRLVARVHRDGGRAGWRVEYHEFAGAFPRALRFVGDDRSRLDLQIALSQVEHNVPLGAEVFEVRIPPAAVPLTIEELRRRGPLGAPDGS